MNSTNELTTAKLSTSPITPTYSTSWQLEIFTASMIINFFLSLPINSYVLWLICTGKGSGLSSDFFILNLSVGEILFSLGSSLGQIVSSYEVFKFVCFVSSLPIMGRPLFLSLICVERYLAVVYPVTFLKYKPLRYRVACSVVVWVTVLSFGVFCMMVLPTNNLYLYLCVILPEYSLFLFIKLFCCLAVVKALKYPGPGDRAGQREEANLMKRRAMNIILIITVATIVYYIPIYFAGFLYYTLSQYDFAALWNIGVALSMVVAYVKPLLYIHKFGNFSLVSRVLCNRIST